MNAEKWAAHLEQVMKPSICFFRLLRAANMTFSAREVSLSTDVATYFALRRIISWTAVDIDFESDRYARRAVAYFHRLSVR